MPNGIKMRIWIRFGYAGGIFETTVSAAAWGSPSYGLKLRFELCATCGFRAVKLQFELHLQPAVGVGGSNPRVCMWHCALSYINPTWKSRCPAFLGQFWELDLHTLRWVSHGFQLHPNRQLPTAWAPAIYGFKLQFGAAPVPCMCYGQFQCRQTAVWVQDAKLWFTRR